MNPILPPYPNPAAWGTIRQLQDQSKLIIWSVPSERYDYDAISAYGCLHGHQNTPHHAGPSDASEQNASSDAPEQNVPSDALDSRIIVYEGADEEKGEDEEDGDEIDGLIMSEEWTKRFADTLKKMKKKHYKAQRNKRWVKN